MSEFVAIAVEFAESCKSRLLSTLDYVPDDKLNWVPKEGGHSALRIAAHAALSSRHFATMLEGKPFPDIPQEELLAQSRAEEEAVSSREEVVKLIRENHEKVISALQGLPEERIAGEVQTPFGGMPTKFMIMVIGRHLDGHASQIDYLQTLWGDREQHF